MGLMRLKALELEDDDEEEEADDDDNDGMAESDLKLAMEGFIWCCSGNMISLKFLWLWWLWCLCEGDMMWLWWFLWLLWLCEGNMMWLLWLWRGSCGYCGGC